MGSLLIVVLQVATTRVSDSDSHSIADFSLSKFLLVVFHALVLVSRHRDRSDSLCSSSSLLSPRGAVDAGVVLLVSSSWRSDRYPSSSYPSSISTESPPSVCYCKRCWCLLPSQYGSVTYSRALPSRVHSCSPPGKSSPFSISCAVPCATSKRRRKIRKAHQLIAVPCDSWLLFQPVAHQTALRFAQGITYI